jgi:hypothetical protein
MMAILISAAESGLALGPAQPPIQWVPWALAPGVDWPGREFNRPLHLYRGQECVELPRNVFMA